ncbi:unnamed protein product [Trichobilharzia regenti]|nr:unnamed protein product [Trichobilharzia regenti]
MRIRSSHMPPSDTLVHTGDLLTAVYYVVKGSLEVVTTDDVILGVLNPGDFFGGLPPLATVQKNLNTNNFGNAWDYCVNNRFANMNTSSKVMQSEDYASMQNDNNNHNGNNANGVVYQPNPPPKSRFAVRALTYADKHSATMPNVETFLDATSSWHIVCPLLLSGSMSSRTGEYSKLSVLNSSAQGRYSDNPFTGKPPWELERFQRLFDHGALSYSPTAYPNAQVPVYFTDSLYNPCPTAPCHQPPMARKSESITICSTHSSEQNPSLPVSPIINNQSLQERRLRMRSTRNISPKPSHSSILNLPTHSTDITNHAVYSPVIPQTISHTPGKKLMEEEKQIIDILVARFANVENFLRPLILSTLPYNPLPSVLLLSSL